MIRKLFEPQNPWNFYEVRQCMKTSFLVEKTACQIESMGLTIIPQDILLTTFENNELLLIN